MFLFFYFLFIGGMDVSKFDQSVPCFQMIFNSSLTVKPVIVNYLDLFNLACLHGINMCVPKIIWLSLWEQ